MRSIILAIVSLVAITMCDVAQAQYPFGRTDYYPFGHTTFYAPPVAVAAPAVPYATTAVVARRPVLRPFARPAYFSVAAPVAVAPTTSYYAPATPLASYYPPAAPLASYYPPAPVTSYYPPAAVAQPYGYYRPVGVVARYPYYPTYGVGYRGW